jgi:ParB family transcriptional regulator, chromosome partitioning protein
MKRRRGLGSGLDALIPADASASQTIRLVAIDAIRQNRNQPRTRFDEQTLTELADSIREHGLIQPLIVTEHEAGGYELIAGERRWRAAARAGLAEVPVLVKDATPLQLLELALVENVQRADLNPLEEGMAYQTLKDEFGMTDEAIARRVGKSRVAVVNARRLIRLIGPARQALLDGSISAGHGRALLRLEGADAQGAVLELIEQLDLSVREAERLTELAQHGALSSRSRQALLRGSLSPAHAQALLRVSECDAQEQLLDRVLAENLAVRSVEQLVAHYLEGQSLDQAVNQLRVRNRGDNLAQTSASAGLAASVEPSTHADAAPALRVSQSAEDLAAQRMFEAALGTPVSLQRSARSIKLTITLYDDEQLQALYDMIGGTAR